MHPVGLKEFKKSAKAGNCLFCGDPISRIARTGRHPIICKKQGCRAKYSKLYQRDARSPKGRGLGHIYFIQPADGGPIKIGFAKKLKERLATIKVFCPYKLSVLLTLPGSVWDERRLHDRFAGLRLHGEWFRDGSELLAFIETTKAN